MKTNMFHTIDELYRILSDPFSEGLSLPELEELMIESSEVIRLVGDWAAARKKLDIFEDDETSTNHDYQLADEQFCNASQALYDAYAKRKA